MRPLILVDNRQAPHFYQFLYFRKILQQKPCVLMVLLSPLVNQAGKYNALMVVRAFVDFIGDPAFGNPVQKNLTMQIYIP